MNRCPFCSEDHKDGFCEKVEHYLVRVDNNGWWWLDWVIVVLGVVWIGSLLVMAYINLLG